jgi:hypothetical protein
MITSELHKGSPSGEIEAFFKRHGVVYDYDKFSNRYQAIIRYDRFEGVSIYVFLDDQKNFSRSEVHTYGTLP